MSTLIQAVESGSLEALKRCIESVADVDIFVEDDDGLEQAPLMMASRRGKLNLVQYLAGRGAKLDKRTKRSAMIAAFLAAQEGHLAVLQFSSG